MASIHKRERSPYYYMHYRAPDGRRVYKCTKQTERSAALAFALELERASALAKRMELTETAAQEALASILKFTGETLRRVTIAEHFQQWMAGKEARKSASTAERYGAVARFFLTSLGNKAGKPITALVARDVDRFLDARLKQGVAPRTAALDVKIIRTALNAARRQGLITINPAEAVELPAAKGTERGTFTNEQIRMLLKEAKGEWKTLILLGYYTGARLSDCCAMSWEHVNLAKGTLTYTQGKTGHKVAVPLHPQLLAHLETLAGTDETDPHIMPGMANLKSGGRHGLSQTFKNIMRKAGVDCQSVKGAGVRRQSLRTFHSLRHSFTSALANAGVSEELRMKLTGHTTKAIHRGYTHHELAILQAAVDKLPGLSI